jgi:hypothetical protein
MTPLYLLLLILHFGPGEPDQAWVVDYDMSHDDCNDKKLLFETQINPKSGIEFACDPDDGEEG